MLLPWLLVTIASLLFLFIKFSKGKRSKRKLKDYWTIAVSSYKFCFKVKSEDRLNALKTIHKYFPRYTRFKIFNYDNIIIYDPELCRKMFNSQTACQRPFRNCIQLENGLLSSECELSSNEM